VVERLAQAGWFVEHTKGGLTLRGYQTAQDWFRGPSDLPEAKAERNAKRPTTRAGRGATVERPDVVRGASVERRGATPTNKTNKPRARSREEKKPDPPKPLGQIMEEIGATLPWQEPKNSSTS
jgi:hypothetical protein